MKINNYRIRSFDKVIVAWGIASVLIFTLVGASQLPSIVALLYFILTMFAGFSINTKVEYHDHIRELNNIRIARNRRAYALERANVMFKRSYNKEAV
jgi:hypothetical protein